MNFHYKIHGFVGQRNDPTVIIHAHERREFESKFLTPE
jgi:hypothetical protein